MSDDMVGPFVAVEPDLKALRRLIGNLTPYCHFLMVSRPEDPDRNTVIVHPKGDYSAGHEVLFFSGRRRDGVDGTFIVPWVERGVGQPPAPGEALGEHAQGFNLVALTIFSELLSREGVKSFLDTTYD